MSEEILKPMFEHHDLGNFNTGWLPYCPYCNTEFKKGEIGKIINDPKNFKVKLEMTCSSCKKTSEIISPWSYVTD